ncbi:MAG: hypothetical protein AB1758_27425 [Candidatus Eremiobacterota bacterium]
MSRLLLVGFCCVLAAGLARGESAPAALVTDLGGRVQLVEGSREVPVVLVQSLPAEARIRVAEGGWLELAMYQDARTVRARGPLDLRVAASGPVKLSGQGSLQVSPPRQSGLLDDGARSLSDLGGYIDRPGGYFSLTTHLQPSAPPTLSWETMVGPPFDVRLLRTDEEGVELQELWRTRTEQASVVYAGPPLALDTTYTWEVLHREEADVWSERASFRILSEASRASVQRARQEAAALSRANPDSPAAHLLLAGVLVRHHLLQAALEEVLEAARQRPGDPGIRELLTALSRKVEAAGAVTGQE